MSVVDLIEGAPELVAFGAAEAQLETVQGHDTDLASIATASADTAGVGLALTTLLSGLACWGCLMVGIPAARSGALSGVLLAVIVLIPLAAFELVVGLPTATQALAKVRQSAARVFAVTEAPVPVVEPLRPALLPAGPPSIAVRSVWARYPDATTSALRGIDLDLSPGRRVAVVGPSGSGKSTLAAVLLRFLATESGEVTLNGTAFDRFDGDQLRTVVGLVDQDAHLFETTIAENLRVGRREATDKELCRVLHRVGLGPWLDELPLGMATEVGRFGSRLSGGQRQRVAVARALLADFPVLLLDEPSEHLDPEAAAALTVDLLAVTAGRSLLFITHRLTGLESVDEIVVMDQGLIVERGTHHALLAEGGHYSKLWWEELRVDVLADNQSGGGSPGVVVPLFPPSQRESERGIFS